MNDRPQLRADVELLGELPDTAFAERQWLIHRGDRFVQVSELLYRVAEQLDGERTLEQVAERVTELTPWLVSPDNVRQLLETKLLPLGLVETADGSQRARPPASPLQLLARTHVVGPRVLDPVTSALQLLFAPALLVPALGAIAAAHAWLYLEHGLTAAVLEVLFRPALVVPLFGLVIVAGVFHELGHASALRYGGGRARGIGFGFYLIWPALYTDTSDAYRLPRWARVRVDLGGFYFHALFALAVVGLALVTGWDFLLLTVLLINLEVLRQLLFPFVRFDGYWLLADLIGVRDLYSHIGPFLRTMGFGSRLRAGGPKLKPWAGRVFAAYLAFAAVALTGLVYVFATRAPEFVAVAWDSLGLQIEAFRDAFDDGDVLGAYAALFQALLLALPFAGAVLVLVSLARTGLRAATAIAAVRAAAQPRS